MIEYESFYFYVSTAVLFAFLYDKNAVANLIKNPQSLPMPQFDDVKDYDWQYKHLTSAITQGILQGESIHAITERLQSAISMNYRSAIRIVRTSMTSAQNAGQQALYNEAEKIGIKLRKQWLATLDNRTRHSHALLDSEVVENDKPFSNGCMFPGDKNGAPAEIINCRCTMKGIVRDSQLQNTKRISKNPITGKTEYVTGMNYAEWYKSKTGVDLLKDTYFGRKNAENAEKEFTSDNENSKIKEIGIQFFANKGLDKQSDKGLLSSIEKWEKRIEEHERYISNPEEHEPNWNILTEQHKQGEIKHWQKEIKNFKSQISQVENLLKERKHNE